MKNILFLFFLFSFIISAQSQSILNKKESFLVVSNNSSHSEEYFLDALSDANMETYRLRNKDVTIVFKEGVEIVLLSATKLVNKGENLDINDYKVSFSEKFLIPIFSVSSNGGLLAEYKAKRK